MRRKVSYYEPAVYRLIRETIEDPAGRSFVILLFLNKESAFSGRFLTPYKIGNGGIRFENTDSFMEKVQKLADQVLEKDRHGELVECCRQWITEETPKQADIVIYFHLSENSEWNGQVMFADVVPVTRFSGRKELHAILKELSDEDRKKGRGKI